MPATARQSPARLGVQPGDPRPELIVGPTGPVFYQDPDAQGYNVAQRRFEATLPLMELPANTPVTLVNWHDKEPQLYVSHGSRWNVPSPERARASTRTMTACTGDRRVSTTGRIRGLLPGVLDERPGRNLRLRWHAVLGNDALAELSGDS